MDTSASLLATFTRTPARGWAVALLSRLHLSFVVLISFTFGLFLPFVRQDLDLSPVEVGMLQGVWWITSASLSLPCSVWFSRFRPMPLILASLVLDVPFLALQGLASSFGVLLLARLCFILCHVIATPARPLLLQQWVAPRKYALVNAIGLSQHSLLLAVAMSTSAALITATTAPWLLMILLTGMGLVWIASPVMEVLPCELPDIRPREIAVIVSLVKTLSGLGFAIGPLVTGLVAQVTGSLQTGLLVLCMLTGVGTIAGIRYPPQHKASGKGVISVDLG